MDRILTVLLVSVCGCVLAPMEAGRVPEPLVAITFDDGDRSVYEIGFRLIRATDPDWAATHFLPVEHVGGPAMVSLAQLREMEAAGWETGGHGRSHENLSSVCIDSVRCQVVSSYRWLESCGLSHASFAYPFGNYNAQVQKVVAEQFRNVRTSHDFHYLDGINRHELGYFAVKPLHRDADLIARVEQARAEGAPLVVIGFHSIVPAGADPPTGYWCTQAAFAGFLRYLKRQELRVVTISEAMDILVK